MKSYTCGILTSHLRKVWGRENKTTTDESVAKNHSIFTPILKQTLAALASLLLTTCSGMVFGYSAILLPQLQLQNNTAIRFDVEEASWIASMAPLQMAVGSLVGGMFMEKFGRKSTHTIICVPTFLSWMSIYFATSTKMILAGRLVGGFCLGMVVTASGVYIGETSQATYRGFLLAGLSFAIALGQLLSQLIGTLLHWQTTALICSLLPLVSLVLFFFVPESPCWLAKKGKIENAKLSFYWCRGHSEEAKMELNILLENQTRSEENKYFKEQLNELIVPEFLKPLGIITVYILSNQWAGVNAITFYSISIIKQTIGDGVNEYLAMIIVAIIRVVASILACVLLRKSGRRPLGLISGAVTALSLFVLSIYSYFVKLYPKISTTESYIPMTALLVYITFISIGFVPLPWAMIGELFPLKHRSIGSGISSFLALIGIFSVVKTSPWMFSNMGSDGSFLMYGMVAFLATIFIFFYLPETKGKPLYEIEELFKRKKKQPPVTDVQSYIKNDNVRIG